MPRKSASTLPKYVHIKAGCWYVRRAYPTSERTRAGKIKYVQIVRRCDPETPERAKEISDAIEAQANSVPAAPTDTIEEFVRSFVRAKKSAVSEQTHWYYNWLCENQIVGSPFGGMESSDVKPKHVQDFYDRLTDKGVSASMVRKVHTLLSMAFNQGMRWETVTRNPTRGVILPKASKRKIEIMTEQQAHAFTNSFPPLVLAFALETWMRPSEYLALTWDDIDLKKGTVEIRRVVIHGDGGDYYFKEPKTRSSHRTIELSHQMITRLIDHWGARAMWIDELKAQIEARVLLAHKKATGANYKRRKDTRRVARETLKNLEELNLVFPSSTGTPFSRNNLGRREMVAACKAAGLPKFSLYCLRHTGASIALANGALLKHVSERLGHADIQITLSTYIHTMRQTKTETVDILSKVLYG